MRVERVAIFGLDFPNVINQIVGLRNGFRELGLGVLTAWPHPNALNLENVLDSFRPDFVFEINRWRNQIPDCSEQFVHVCWIQDIQSQGRRLDENFGGSDLSYFTLPPSMTGHPPELDDSVQYLMPGANPDIFFHRPEPPIFDFSFVGQMFAPLSDKQCARRIMVDGVDCGTVGELATHFRQQDIGQHGHRTDEVAVQLLAFVRRCVPDAESAMVDPAIRNICEEYFPRLADRTRMLDTILGLSDKVGFFGTGPWDAWPRYARHFGGYINRQSKLALVFRRTRVNLHNSGTGIHTRVFDCLACGAPILVNKSPYDGTQFGLDRHFEPGRHYIEYDFETLADVAAAALADDDGRARIGAEAAAAIRAGHTWRHRAEQILRDVKRL